MNDRNVTVQLHRSKGIDQPTNLRVSMDSSCRKEVGWVVSRWIEDRGMKVARKTGHSSGHTSR